MTSSGSFSILEGSSIAGIITWSIGIPVSGGILRDDPRLATTSASSLSFLLTWFRLNALNSEAKFLRIRRYSASLSPFTA